jgi:hypothetical protein
LQDGPWAIADAFAMPPTVVETWLIRAIAVDLAANTTT